MSSFHSLRRPLARTKRARKAHRHALQHRRLSCEPLEDRRLLSVAHAGGPYTVAEGSPVEG